MAIGTKYNPGMIVYVDRKVFIFNWRLMRSIGKIYQNWSKMLKQREILFLAKNLSKNLFSYIRSYSTAQRVMRTTSCRSCVSKQIRFRQHSFRSNPSYSSIFSVTTLALVAFLSWHLSTSFITHPLTSLDYFMLHSLQLQCRSSFLQHFLFIFVVQCPVPSAQCNSRQNYIKLA